LAAFGASTYCLAMPCGHRECMRVTKDLAIAGVAAITVLSLGAFSESQNLAQVAALSDSPAEGATVVALENGVYPMPGGALEKCAQWYELKGDTLWPTTIVGVSADGNLKVNLDEIDTAAESTHTLRGEDCADGSPKIQREVNLSVPLVINGPTFLAPWAKDAVKKNTWVAKSASGTAVQVSLIRKGETVQTKTSDLNTVKLSAPFTKSTPRKGWEIQAISGESVLTKPIYIANKWAPLTEGRHTLEKCSTLTYHVNKEAQPVKINGIEKDISKAFRILGEVTGLNFVPTEDEDTADIKFIWDEIPGPHAALGGQRIRTHNGETTVRGNVQLDTTEAWLHKPGFATNAGSLPGRGALLLHELAHVLGLGHVADQESLMTSVFEPGSDAALSEGDKQGLASMYDPKGCSWAPGLS